MLSLALMLGMLSGMSLTAYAEGQTVVWSGEKAVTQDNPVSIDKDKFSGIKLGDKIVVEFKDADGGLLSLFSNGKCLPGTSYNYVGSWDSAYEVFATQDMIKSLKQYGMDVSGYGYTVTKVSYEAGRDNLDVNTVWSGNFWMDSWSTLELSATSFSDVDWDEIEAIRFISEAGRSNWTLNIRTSWEEDGKVADQSSMTWKDNYFELSLDEIDVAAKLENKDRLYIQGDKDGGEAFNFTQVQLVPKAGYDVTITAGNNMTKTSDSGSSSQTGLSGEMTPVVYNADEGYYFPTDYSVATVNGISVTRNSYTKITVSGTPTADTEITLTAPTEKSKETTPTATFTVTGAYEGTLSGVANGMKYSLDNGTTWTDVSSDANIELTGLSGCTIQVVKKGGNTTADSDPQEITVAQASKPTAVAAHCTSKDNNDGKLIGITTEMEYMKSDAENWTDGTGSDITGLLPGTYFVRVKVTDTTLASENQALTIEPFERTNPFEGRVYNIGDVLYLSNYCYVNFKDGNNRNIYWTAKTADASYYYGKTYQIPTPTWNESKKYWTFPDFTLIYYESEWYNCSFWLGQTDNANGGEIVTGVKCTGGDGSAENPYTFALAFEPRPEASATGYSGAYDGASHGITVSVTDPTSGTTVKYGTAEGTYNLDASPKYTDAGEYTVYYEVKAEGRSTLRGSADISIVKAEVTVTAKDQSIYVGGTVPTLSGADFYTVTGLVGEETLTTAPTLAYQKNGEAATPDSAIVGTYDIVPSGAAASDNYNISYTNGTLTISNKGTQTISAENVTATYGDTDKSVSATVTDPATGGGDISYAVKEGSGDYIEINASTGALTIKAIPADGKAYVIVTAAETSTYTQATKEVTVTINKANAVAATVTANNRTYDGTEKPLVTVDESMLVGGTMYYAATTDNTAPADNLYTTSIPTATDAGTYYVWYKLESDDNYNGTEAAPIEVSIAKRSVTLTSATASKTYDATALTDATVTVTGDGFATGEGATYDVTGTQTQAGESKNTFTYTLNNGTKAANYEITKVEGTLKVEQVDSSGEVIAVSGLVYDGTKKALVDSKVHGGILMYRLGTDGEWTEEIPEAADFGTYTVYYYIKGDGNHKDNGSETEPMGSVDVTIKCPYSNEWVDGKWYNKNGSQTYKPLGDWKKDGKDWMYVDTSGWYPKNRWQKIDFKWYFFDREGHMLKDAYQKSADGKIWYVGKNGAWDEKAAVIGWKQDSKGWWFGLYGKDYLKNTWKMINGNWYYFKADGYVAQNEFVNGWWCNKNGVQRDPVKYSWHKTSKGWWYGVSGGWYAKNATYTIDGKSYTFDKMGYQK